MNRNKISLLPLLLLLILPAMAAAQTGGGDFYADKVGEADKAIEDGNWADAEKCLVEAMHSDPANPFNVLLLSNVGMMQFNQGKDSLALATLNDALTMAPQSVSILANRAKVLTAIGQTEDALADYTRILAIDSMAVEPRFYHGMLAMRKGDFHSARADFDFLDRHFPDSPQTQTANATLNVTLGKWETAIPYFNKIIEKDPQPHFYAGRAQCRLMLEQLQEASDDIAKGLELDPDDGELYLLRAVLNKMRYRIDDARADAEKAQQLGIPRERLKIFF